MSTQDDTATPTFITKDQIEALGTEALGNGDQDLFEIAEYALGGSQASIRKLCRSECARVLVSDPSPEMCAPVGEGPSIHLIIDRTKLIQDSELRRFILAMCRLYLAGRERQAGPAMTMTPAEFVRDNISCPLGLILTSHGETILANVLR